MRVDRFDGDLSIQRDLSGEVHTAHAAPAQFLEQFITVETADRFSLSDVMHCCRCFKRRVRFGDRLAKHRFILLLGDGDRFAGSFGPVSLAPCVIVFGHGWGVGFWFLS